MPRMCFFKGKTPGEAPTSSFIKNTENKEIEQEIKAYRERKTAKETKQALHSGGQREDRN